MFARTKKKYLLKKCKGFHLDFEENNNFIRGSTETAFAGVLA